ncbi:MAG: DUF4340 domain-containing protein [bacterium]|jgi:hypothetical protein
MKRNRIIIATILVLIVAVIAILAGNRYSTLTERESNFAVEDTASVVGIFIADKNDNEIMLERKDHGWLLNGKFETNTRMVDMLLGTLKKIKVRSPVSLASHNNVIRRMAAIGKKVEIYQMVYRINLFDRIKLFKHKKRTRVFYVGDATQDNLGTYMLMEGAENPYIVYLPSFRGFISTRFTPRPDDWKSHVIFNKRLTDIQSVTVKFTREPENSFKVESAGISGDFDLYKLSGREKVASYDTLKLLNFLTSFRDLRYESRLNNSMSPVRIDSIIHSPTLFEIDLTTQGGDTIHVSMFEKKAATEKETNMLISQIPVDFDRMYGLINEGEDFVLLQYYVFDKVLYPLSHYAP